MTPTQHIPTPFKRLVPMLSAAASLLILSGCVAIPPLINVTHQKDSKDDSSVNQRLDRMEERLDRIEKKLDQQQP